MWFIKDLTVTFRTPPTSSMVGKVYYRNAKTPDNAASYKFVGSAIILPSGVVQNIQINGLEDGEIYIVKIEVPGCTSFTQEFNSGRDATIPFTTVIPPTTKPYTTLPPTTLIPSTAPATTIAGTTLPATTTGPAPLCPVIGISDIKTDGFTVTWTPLVGVLYMVNLFDDIGALFFTESHFVGNVGTYTFKNIAPDRSYWVQVVPVKDGVQNNSCPRWFVHTNQGTTTIPVSTFPFRTTLPPSTTIPSGTIEATLGPVGFGGRNVMVYMKFAQPTPNEISFRWAYHTEPLPGKEGMYFPVSEGYDPNDNFCAGFIVTIPAGTTNFEFGGNCAEPTSEHMKVAVIRLYERNLNGYVIDLTPVRGDLTLEQV